MQGRRLDWVRTAALAMLALAAPPARAQVAYEAQVSRDAPKAAVPGRTSMVVSANPIATAAGREIIDAGGSAVDAAIAMQLVLGIVEPQSQGIGGGGFLLTFDAASREITSFDGRETAPASATPALFLDADGKQRPFPQGYVGGHTVGVPGMLRMMEMAHRRHGKLAWVRLFQPAIRIATDGFAISPRLNAALTSARDIARQFPAMHSHYYQADGTPKPVGTVLRNPELAQLLREIATGGADAYYVGPAAARAAAAIAGAPLSPVRVTADEFADYRSVERPPVCGRYRAYTVCSMGPPSSGATTLLGELTMLERFDLGSLGPSSPQAIHLIAEATSLAFADREMYLADPAFAEVPVAGLTDSGYLRARGRLIDPDKAGPPSTAGTPPGLVQSARAPGLSAELPSTSHWAVVDKAGNAATFTGSIQSGFGSFIMVDGYLLNNELTDFAMRPEADGRPIVNRAEAGKRPRSSMSPTLVFDDQGRLVLALGSAGGSRIIGHVLKTIVGVVDWGLDVQQAISLPNLHGANPRIEVEAGTPLEPMKPALEAMGHSVVARANISGLTGIQVIHASDGTRRYLGGVDPRREGVASGD